ncbi:MAG: hypothetical protein D6732_13750 [Methanobacteriota archaeon]|nr:MAG: hypothetical protein D6732_13750 [Euryarchaeota archaeon]
MDKEEKGPFREAALLFILFIFPIFIPLSLAILMVTDISSIFWSFPLTSIGSYLLSANVHHRVFSEPKFYHRWIKLVYLVFIPTAGTWIGVFTIFMIYDGSSLIGYLALLGLENLGFAYIELLDGSRKGIQFHQKDFIAVENPVVGIRIRLLRFFYISFSWLAFLWISGWLTLVGIGLSFLLTVINLLFLFRPEKAMSFNELYLVVLGIVFTEMIGVIIFSAIAGFFNRETVFFFLVKFAINLSQLRNLMKRLR